MLIGSNLQGRYVFVCKQKLKIPPGQSKGGGGGPLQRVEYF